MIGEGLSREVAGTLHIDVSTSANDQTLDQTARQGAVEDARTAMRQALQNVPGHAAASANLGAFLRISGETEAAEIPLRATVAREPDNAAVDDRRGAETVHDASAPAAGISL